MVQMLEMLLLLKPPAFRQPQQTNHTNWQIGRKEDSGSNLVGNVARLGVYSPALTISEIQVLAATLPYALPPIDIVIVVFDIKSGDAYNIQDLKTQVAQQYGLPIGVIQIVLRETSKRMVSDLDGFTQIQHVEMRVPTKHAHDFSSQSLRNTLANPHSTLAKHIASSNINIEVK